ncbi:MAG: hypothetical protein II784_00945 [Oscillospiraceae bacterium]|nr:hypothetical protein [Oscillospiraceae bacterium]
MRNFFGRLMQGRYGTDGLSRFLSIAAFVLAIAAIFFRGLARNILWTAAIILIAFAYYRIFSRNFDARSRENQKYLRVKNRIAAGVRLRRDMLRQRKTHRFFRCPECRAMMRVPKGKGKVQIRCSKCGNAFVKRT